MKLVATANSLHFFDRTSLSVPVLTDADEFSLWQKRGDPVLHIHLRDWADIVLIAPLSANTLASLANGVSNNLLVRAFFQ